MKRLLAILGVFALLGTLFVVTSASPSNAGNQCDEVTTVTTQKDDCKPDRPRCENIDKETAKLLKELDGWSWTDCCIDYDSKDVPAWAEQYRCAPEPCQAELGTDVLEYLEKTYGPLFDATDCCIELELESLPASDYKYRCEVPEPEPEPSPTPVEVEVEVEVPVFVPVPIEVPVIVDPPVTQVVTRTPAFTG